MPLPASPAARRHAVLQQRTLLQPLHSSVGRQTSPTPAFRSPSPPPARPHSHATVLVGGWFEPETRTGSRRNSRRSPSSNSRGTFTVVMAAINGASSGPATAGSAKRLVLWFRNDLRLLDNYIVHEAVNKIKKGEYSEVLPVYFFDPRVFGLSDQGMLKTGANRARFQIEAVMDLKKRLQSLGSDLLVSIGKPEALLPALLAGSSSSMVLTQQEVTSEEEVVDKAVAKAVAAGGGKLQPRWGYSLYHLEELSSAQGAPFFSGMRNMPDMFTPFKEKCEQRVQIRPEVPAPTAGQLPLPKAGVAAELFAFVPTFESMPYAAGHRPKAAVKHPPGGAGLQAAEPFGRSCPLCWTRSSIVSHLNLWGGETAALERLKYYLWDSKKVSTYFDTRNGMLGGDYSTKFSPWLATGSLSPRTIYHQLKGYEKKHGANKSTYWVQFELTWRDFYRFFALKHSSSIFLPGGTTGAAPDWAKNPQAFRAWAEGRTGLPLVDANMRELNATGFMSNRGRQNVASYLALDLNLDWRSGGEHFESMLLDYDVSSNWGNWAPAHCALRPVSRTTATTKRRSSSPSAASSDDRARCTGVPPGADAPGMPLSSVIVTVAELATQFGLSHHGDGTRRIDGVGTLAGATGSQLSFLSNSKYDAQLSVTNAGVVVLREENLAACTTAALVAKDPYVAYAKIAALFERQPSAPPGIHASAVVSALARVSPTASIGPCCVIEDGAVIEDGVILGPHCIIGTDCTVGAQSRLVARVTLVIRVTLGKRVLVHPGAVIGSDGFGLAFDTDHWVKLPQLGGVRIGDDCEIGANTTIDRGALDDTVLEEDVRLDNQIQIAHNVFIGPDRGRGGRDGAGGGYARSGGPGQSSSSGQGRPGSSGAGRGFSSGGKGARQSDFERFG
ncbi:MAG: hypothetical protein WDW36_008901 [Sanguina aurantia]